MIKLSQSAKKYLKDSLTEAPANALGIRLGLRDAGCSGFAYTIDFTDKQNADDEVYNFDELYIFVAKEFSQALDGMEIDYATQGINSTLQFNNPNVVNSCGCGESFQFKES